MGKTILKSASIRAEIDEKMSGLQDLHKQVVEVEDREFKQKEKDRIEKTLDEVGKLETREKAALKDESMLAKIEGYSAQLPRKESRDPANLGAKFRPRTKGAEIVESPEWQAFLKESAPGGRFSEKAGLRGAPVFNSPDLIRKSLRRKDVITGSSETSAGALVDVDQTGIYEPLGRYPLTLRDLISVRQTVSDTVEFVRQTTQVTQAAPTAEPNVAEYSGASGEVSGEKPEGSMTFERVQAVVKTIPVWIPATKRALSDAPQLRGIIDDDLISDCEEELENQLLNGNGVGENFTGLANTANTLVQAFSVDIAQTARMAITNLLINGRQIPTAYLLNPQDWESFDLLQDSEGRYYWGGPMAQGTKTLWGVPVAQSFFQTQGTGWLGNWRKMVLWDREQATITVSDSHADFFIRNMVAILAELRAAMGVIRPTAFVEIDLTSGS